MVGAGKNGEPEEHVDAAKPSQTSTHALDTLVHELRNPLAPIRNAAELLRTLCTDPRQLQAIDIVSRQVSMLTRTLDDVTGALASQQNQLLISKQTVDIADVVEPAVRTVRPVVDARRQGLLVALPKEPVQMHCDPLRLSQVVQTLLENATGHTHEGGSIALKATAAAGKLMIEVADDGAGIAADKLRSLFNVFAPRRPASTDVRSGGLNLAISRNIVEMHGGSIEAYSEGVGRGSRFIIELPLSGEARSSETSESPDASDARRILIIEDHEDSAISLKDTLAAAGHAVVLSTTGEFGIALAHTFKPEAVIIDIGLPGMDGFDVAQRLRLDDVTRDALLIAISGYSLKRFRELAAYSAFRHYLLKPVSPETILTIIEGSLNRARRGPSSR